ncbi:hypothetical protein M8C21_028175 [Ambrosia artemisiifolia]|uniref:AAA+ ATPase domain-containing protein n=1 Tax=Ambrosia artemisiifolia TaxID=4212 RepID=A0AAD5BKF1_AMBAR|nr:hypothetical protein M8C21_028175 [Ambrosia artemisiifolia]
MENKHLFMSALSMGVGVGVGLGMGKTVSRWTGGGDDSTGIGLTPQTMEREMLSMIVDGKDSKITFDEFPYYLSEQTRVLLTSAAFVYLKNIDFSKHTRNLAPASRTILLSGPAELYQQMLAKALAHYFEAKLLLLDVTDFSLKVQSKYGTSSKETAFQRSTSETTLARMSDLLGSTLSMFQTKQEEKGTLRRQSSVSDFGSRRNASSSINMEELATKCPTIPAPLRRTSSLAFDEKLLIQTLYKIITFISKNSPMVLYLRDVEKLLCRSQRCYSLFQKMLKKISGPVLIIGSQVVDLEKDYRELDERITSVFPYSIEIKPPQEENHLVSWKSQLEEDMKKIQFQDNRNHISEVLAENDLDCDDLASICVADTIDLSKYIEEIVVSAISYHLTHTKNPEYRNGKLVISSTSLSHGLSLFQEGKSVRNTSKDACGPKPETKVESIRPSKVEAAVPKNADNVAPPTPKAPAVPADNEFEKRIRPEVIPANEIGVTFSDVGALDDIKESLQELVMLPLRRPDLFIGGLLKPCRGILLFGPPGTGKTMLAKAIANEAGASFINVSMSTITSKWFGEDEKNVRALFTLAAKVSPTIIFVDEVDSMLGQRSRAGEHEAMRKIKNEFMTHWDGLLTKPGERILEKKRLAESGEGPQSPEENTEEKVITIRPLKMEDFREAKNQVAASFASEGSIMSELKQWNEQYGEGGSRKKEQLSYFL